MWHSVNKCKKVIDQFYRDFTSSPIVRRQFIRNSRFIKFGKLKLVQVWRLSTKSTVVGKFKDVCVKCPFQVVLVDNTLYMSW